MNHISLSEAKKNLFSLINDRPPISEPIFIQGRTKAAILVSKEEWEGMQETLLIMQDREFAESLLEARKTPISECVKLEDLKW